MNVGPLEECQISKLLRISAAELGSDYLDRGDFEKALEGGDRFCFVASLDDRPIGFAICDMLGPGDVDPELHLDGADREALLSLCPVGYIASVSVDDSHKGCGAGTAMLRRCMEELERRKAGVICAMAWKSVRGTVNIARPLERLGLVAVREVQGYWNDPRAFPNGHDCPVCGNPCSCSAMLFVDEGHTSMFLSTDEQNS